MGGAARHAQRAGDRPAPARPVRTTPALTENGPVTVDGLVVGDEPDRWRGLGFRVEDDDTLTIGSIVVRLAGEQAGRGLLGWSLRGLAGDDLDGLATRRSDAPSREQAPPHPNAVTLLDHVVAFSPDLDRTVAKLERAGLDLRRIREEPTPAGAPRQAFFRLGETILEAIQLPPERIERAGGPDGPARLWGLAVVAPDLGPAAEVLGEHGSGPRPAVQEGREILTVRRSAGLTVPLAFMTERGE